MIVRLSDFRRRFNVSWTTLLAGWRGFESYRRLITISDIQQFAMEKLEIAMEKSKIAGESSSNLSELTIFWAVEQDEIDSALDVLSATDSTNYETEVHKWVICLLEKQIQELPDDPIYGLLELTNFWSSLEYPDYSPHQIQGVGNEISPQNYYTQENFKNAVEKHKNWIENECRKLSGSSIS